MRKIKDLLFSSFIEILVITVLIITKCYTDNLASISSALKIVASISSFIIILYYIFSAKYSKSCFMFLGFIIITTFSSYLGIYADAKSTVLSYLPIFALFMYIEMAMNYDGKKLIKNLYYSLLALTFINFVTIIAYPSGLYMDKDFNYKNNWFFKYDNIHMFYYIPTMMLALIVNKKEFSLINIFTYIIIGYSVFYCFSANSVVCFVLFIALYIWCKKKKKEFSIYKFFNIYIIAFFGIVIFRLQNIFRWLIVDVLKKDLTFTNRTIIWDKIIALIKNKPILGYGSEPASVINHKLGSIHWTHAHNTFLDIVYKSGFVGLGAFLGLLYCSFRNINKIKEKKYCSIITIGLFCCLIMMIFESRQNHIGLFIVLAIANNMYKVDKEESVYEE